MMLISLRGPPMSISEPAPTKGLCEAGIQQFARDLVRLHIPTIVALTVLAITMFGLSACSPSSSGHYVDKQYGFSIRVPSGWKAPSSGTTGITSDNVQSYVVHFVQPPGFRVVVRPPIPDLNRVRNGTIVRNNPRADCPTECIFRRIRVSGRLGILTEALDKQGVPNAFYVSTNSKKYGYEIQWITVTNFNQSQFQRFHRVVRSFHIKK